jgi:hypothetical protein
MKRKNSKASAELADLRRLCYQQLLGDFSHESFRVSGFVLIEWQQSAFLTLVILIRKFLSANEVLKWLHLGLFIINFD